MTDFMFTALFRCAYLILLCTTISILINHFITCSPEYISVKETITENKKNHTRSLYVFYLNIIHASPTKTPTSHMVILK